MSKKTANRLLDAVIISSTLTLIYAIVAPFIITGMFAALVIFMGGIALFVGSIIFYFIYIHFRTIKKLPWLFGGIVTFITFTILVNSDIDMYFANYFNRSKLPKKYESYVSLDTNKPISFGRYQMELAFRSYEPIKHFISTQSNLIVITSKIPNDRDAKEIEEDSYGGGSRIFQDITTYKLNGNGDIIDQYTFKRTHENFTEILFDDYIVNLKKDYYKTWIIDGDTTAKPFISINKDLKWTDDQQIKAFEEMYDKAEYYKIAGYNYSSKNPSEQQITYFTDGKWYKLFVNTYLPNREGKPDDLGETTNKVNLFGKYDTGNWGDEPNYKYLKPTYFQRIKLENVTHSIGGNTPSSDEPSWNGNLYCQLYVDKDILKFKIPMSFGKHGATSKFYEAKGEKIAQLKNELEEYFYPYFYYSSTRLNFKLFTIKSNQLYIIKQLKKI